MSKMSEHDDGKGMKQMPVSGPNGGGNGAVPLNNPGMPPKNHGSVKLPLASEPVQPAVGK